MDMNELKTKRTTVKLSQNQLSQLLGISIETIKSWEQGRNPISKISAIAINTILSDIESKQRQTQRQKHIQILASKTSLPVP